MPPPKILTRSRMPTSPWPTTSVGGRTAGTVVTDFEPKLVAVVLHVHLRLARTSVLQGIGEPLLHDPVGGEVEAWRQRDRLTADLEPYGQPGGSYVVHECVEVAESRMRQELEFVVVMSHGVEQAAHLRESGASGLLDVREGLAILRVGLGHPVAHSPHLQDHHADGMRDDIMELSRDPSAFLGHRDASRRLPLSLGPGRAFLGGLGLLGSLPAARSRPASRSRTAPA